METSLEKYLDFTVLTLELLNAKRTFSFSMHSERNFRRLLWREKVVGMVMSMNTLLHIQSIYSDLNRFLNEFDIFDNSDRIVHISNIPVAVVNEMDDGNILLLNDKEEAIVVKIS